MSTPAVQGEGLEISGAAPSKTARRVPELDGLRGTAILLVILCHYVGNAGHAPLGLWPHRFLSAFTAGWSGVDLFFVLSGFLIGGILLNARESPNYFKAFYVRRAYRILPIYYSWTLLFAVTVIAGTVFFPGRLGVSGHDLVRVPVQLFFLQNMFADMPRFTWIWFNVTWSLAVEEQFYILAPPLVRFLTTRSLVIVLGATICAAPVLRFLVFEHVKEGNYLAVFAMPCRADALAWGMLLAAGWRTAWFREMAHKNATKLRGALVILFFGAGALLWWLAHPLSGVTVTIGFSWLAILFSALLLTILSNPEGWIAGVMRWKFLGWLGGISYCVYLVHDAFNFLAHRVFLHAEPQIYTAKGVGVSLLALAATLGVASVSWRCLEKPLIRRGHTYSYGEGATA